MKVYAGLGSRKAPDEACQEIIALGEMFARLGWALRSGGAPGADHAFEVGCDRGGGSKEIYLPWKSFNKHLSSLYEIPSEAYEIAKQHHPRWDSLSQGTRKCLARDVMQVLGQDVRTPCHAIICWTPDGCESFISRTSQTGGTGLAISLASTIGIPVFNLKLEDSVDRIDEFLKEQRGL